MPLRIPSTGTPFSPRDLLRAFLPLGDVPQFEERFGRWIGSPWCRFVNSGTTALFLILKALKVLRPDRDQVLMPAYTAPSLTLPIKRAGLKVVLSDVDPETFNADPNDVRRCFSDRTLAFLLVPMFGLPCDVRAAQRMADDHGAFLIEDAASAMGSKYEGSLAGTAGDVGFISFNRGKNLSTVTGGAILSGREEIQRAVATELESLPDPTVSAEIQLRAKAVGLGIAVRSLWYTLLYPVVSGFKYTSLHTTFEVFRYTDFQARLGTSLLRSVDRFLTHRHKIGILLLNSFSGTKGIGLPRILPGGEAVFNQFPILLPDRDLREAAHRASLRVGVEATTLYPEPIHRLYDDLGYPTDPDPFPYATSISRRILLLPTHPLVGEKRILEAATAVKQILEG